MNEMGTIEGWTESWVYGHSIRRMGCLGLTERSFRRIYIPLHGGYEQTVYGVLALSVNALQDVCLKTPSHALDGNAKETCVDLRYHDLFGAIYTCGLAANGGSRCSYP
jgi:hypothetical protein